jgi:hypothetical protein
MYEQLKNGINPSVIEGAMELVSPEIKRSSNKGDI